MSLIRVLAKKLLQVIRHEVEALAVKSQDLVVFAVIDKSVTLIPLRRTA
jgi:hypothetical protein